MMNKNYVQLTSRAINISPSSPLRENTPKPKK